MKRKQSYVTVTDQFCGAGGSSIGATRSGAELRLALNHWQLAIDTHNTNFPNADHDCTDISACDPRRYPTTDILITSPECTNHSLAKGRMRKWQRQYEMFGKVQIDPSEERSRATMWDVPRFAEFHDYNAVIVENVVDARMWAMWDAWLHAMSSLGYDHQCVYLNSMHMHPTPQSRDRMYIVFWKHGNRKPDLAIRPEAWCQNCAKNVSGIQSWKNGRTAGRYRRQYEYCCPDCSQVVEPYYYCAANAIDWAIPAQRIGDRAKPLKPATRRRIEIGLKKFGAQPHLVVYKDSKAVDKSISLTDPLTTQVASCSQHGLVIPFIAELHRKGTARGVDEPLATLCASGGHHAVVTAPVPFLIDTKFSHAMNDRSSSLNDAMPTQTGQQSRALVIPPFIASYYGQGEPAGVDQPLGTLSTHDRHALVVPPFILSDYTRVSGVQAAIRGMDEPLPTVPGRALHYLVEPAQTAQVQVDDCGFRMLEPHECGKAMAFPDTYVVLGNKREKIKQFGNAVTPPAMEFLVQRVMASLR